MLFYCRCARAATPVTSVQSTISCQVQLHFMYAWRLFHQLTLLIWPAVMYFLVCFMRQHAIQHKQACVHISMWVHQMCESFICLASPCFCQITVRVSLWAGAPLGHTRKSGKPARMSQGVKQTSREPVKGVCNSCISSNILNCSD